MNRLTRSISVEAKTSKAFYHAGMCERETENMWAAEAVCRAGHARGRGMHDRYVNLPRSRSRNKEEGVKKS